MYDAQSSYSENNVQQKSPKYLNKAMEHNGSVLLTNEQCTKQLEWTQILLIQNVWAAQQISTKIRPNFWVWCWRNNLHISIA